MIQFPLNLIFNETSVVVPEVPDCDTRFKITFTGLYGSQLIASKVNGCAYGIAMIMALQYFKLHSSGDSIQVKGIVVLLMILSSLEAIFVNAQIVDYFVLKFGQSDLFNDITYTVLGKYITIYLTAFAAQIFYATRIWSLTRYMTMRLRLLTIPVVALALIQITAGLTLVAFMIKAGTFSDLGKISFKTYVIFIQGTAAAACDIAITASFSFIFHSNRSGFRNRTHSLLNRLIIYAVNRAAATSVCALLGVTMFRYGSGTYYYMIPVLVNTHIYVISVISVLSTRGSLQEADHSIHLTDIITPSVFGGSAINDNTCS